MPFLRTLLKLARLIGSSVDGSFLHVVSDNKPWCSVSHRTPTMSVWPTLRNYTAEHNAAYVAKPVSPALGQSSAKCFMINNDKFGSLATLTNHATISDWFMSKSVPQFLFPTFQHSNIHLASLGISWHLLASLGKLCGTWVVDFYFCSILEVLKAMRSWAYARVLLLCGLHAPRRWKTKCRRHCWRQFEIWRDFLMRDSWVQEECRVVVKSFGNAGMRQNIFHVANVVCVHFVSLCSVFLQSRCAAFPSVLICFNSCIESGSVAHTSSSAVGLAQRLFLCDVRVSLSTWTHSPGHVLLGFSSSLRERTKLLHSMSQMSLASLSTCGSSKAKVPILSESLRILSNSQL